MSHNEHHCDRERGILYEIIGHLVEENNALTRIVEGLLPEIHIAVSAKGELMSKTVQPGVKSLFTFTEFDGPNGTGNKVKASGPITFASDNTSVATVDGTTQRPNADGFGVDVDVISGMTAGVANITGVDPASTNKVAAGDVLTVTAPVGGVALSATGVLS